MRKTASSGGVATGIAPRHLLPAAVEIAERIGRQVYVREGQKPLSGIASALRGVPHAQFRQ